MAASTCGPRRFRLKRVRTYWSRGLPFSALRPAHAPQSNECRKSSAMGRLNSAHQSIPRFDSQIDPMHPEFGVAVGANRVDDAADGRADIRVDQLSRPGDAADVDKRVTDRGAP